jgi:hypothetical protein
MVKRKLDNGNGSTRNYTEMTKVHAPLGTGRIERRWYRDIEFIHPITAFPQESLWTARQINIKVIYRQATLSCRLLPWPFVWQEWRTQPQLRLIGNVPSFRILPWETWLYPTPGADQRRSTAGVAISISGTSK